jgi:hypothetical protein
MSLNDTNEKKHADASTVVAVGKRKRLEVEEEPVSNHSMCQACQVVDIEPPQPRFTLFCSSDTATNCDICAGCFSKCSSDRHCKTFLECPVCQSRCRQWTVNYTKTAHTRRRTIESSLSHTSEEIKPDQSEDPVRYHQSLAADSEASGADEFIGIALTTCRESRVIHSSNMYKVEGDCNDWDENQIHLLEDIFQNLHSMLITNDKERRRVNIDPSSMPTPQAFRALVANDYSPLCRMIFILGYGERLAKHTPCDPEAENWKRVLTTSFAAADLIRHLRDEGSSGVVKTVTTALGKAFGIPKDLLTYLCEIGVCSAYQTIRRRGHKDFAEKLLEGSSFRFERHDHLTNLFDNVGFFQGGNADRVGYLQSTLQVIAVTPAEELVKLGIYPDRNNPDAQVLCRKRKNWADERMKNNVGYDEVLAPKEKDHNQLATRTMSVIDELLKIVVEENMFTYEEAEEMIETGMHEWYVGMPDLFGRTSVEREETALLALVEHDHLEAVVVEDESVAKTHFEANNAYVDVLMMKDLSKKDTCQDLIDYTFDIQKQMLEKESPEGWEDIPPISELDTLLMACDGAPAATMERIKIAHPEKVPACILSGGFHMMLSGYKAQGKLFAKTHLEDIFSLWRKTEGKLKWVMEPGDPNQIEDELIMMLLGLFTHAILGLIETKREADPNAEFELSAVDVLEHMLARGKKYPMVFLILNSIPLAGMIFILQDAEANADAEAYLSAMRLLLSVFCSSHQTGYVFLICQFFQNWFCASDAERALYENVFLFRQTKNGRNIFPDCFVEWSVRYLRAFTGKKAVRKNYGNIVCQAALLLNERCSIKQSVKKEGKSSPDTEEERKFRSLDKVMQECLLYFRDLNLFGPGPPLHVPAKPWKTRKDMDRHDWEEASETECKSPSGRMHVNPDLLFHLTTGLERSKSYFTHFNVEGDLASPERSEQVVSLALIEGDVSKVNTATANNAERYVSVDATFLKTMGLINVAELKKELKDLNSTLKAIFPAMETIKAQKQQPSQKPPNKLSYIDAVILARQQLILQDADWAIKRRAELTAASDTDSNADSYEIRRDRELRSPLYSFEGTDARREYASKRYKFTPPSATTAAAVAAVASPSNSDRHIGSQDTTASSPSTAGCGAARNVLKNANVESMDADW